MGFTITPIATRASTPQEHEQDAKLSQWLVDHNLIDSTEALTAREEVLLWLEDLIKRWVKKVAVALQQEEWRVEEANANLYTFGSYRLGVHGPGDDIDALCIAPNWCVRRGHFFGEEPHSLERMLRGSSCVLKVQSVVESFVPVIKLQIRNFDATHVIDIDLTFAQLGRDAVPQDFDLQGRTVLRGMTEESVRSVNGCRVTDKIGQLVPNKPAFISALRYLKFWGKRRGIYSNVMGYLGGINFAIIVCYVTQLFPNLCGAAVVQKFFSVVDTWNWAVPLRLTEISEKVGDAMTDRMVWDPRLPKDGKAIFPIITPCYPANNSTYNVSECTKAVMLAEFKRGKELTKEVAYDLDVLVEQEAFFSPKTYANYLQITVEASSQEDFEAWSGYMGAKVKGLAMRIQTQLQCRPWPKEFMIPRGEDDESVTGQIRSAWFMGVKKRPPANAATAQFAVKRVDLRAHVNDFTQWCNHWDRKKPGMTFTVTSVTYDKLPGWVFPGGVHPSAAADAPPAAVSAEAAATAAAPAAADAPAPSTAGGARANADGGEAAARRSADASTTPDAAAREASTPGAVPAQGGPGSGGAPQQGVAGGTPVGKTEAERAEVEAAGTGVDASAATRPAGQAEEHQCPGVAPAMEAGIAPAAAEVPAKRKAPTATDEELAGSTAAPWPSGAVPESPIKRPKAVTTGTDDA